MIESLLIAVAAGVVVALVNYFLGGSKSTQDTLADIRERLGKIEGKIGI